MDFEEEDEEEGTRNMNNGVALTAVVVFGKEKAKNLVFLQKRIVPRNMYNVVTSLTPVVDSAILSNFNKQNIGALVQS